MADGERDIFKIHSDYNEEVLESVLQMEADAANEAAQLLFDALVAIHDVTTEDAVRQIAQQAIEAVNREE